MLYLWRIANKDPVVSYLLINLSELKMKVIRIQKVENTINSGKYSTVIIPFRISVPESLSGILELAKSRYCKLLDASLSEILI